MQSQQKASPISNIRKNRIRATIRKIIFDADTPAGKAFDIGLFIAIVLSIVGMMLESVKEIDDAWGFQLMALDWVLTVLFTLEYGLRIWTTGKPFKYIFSFYGIVDLLAILPTYFTIFYAGANALSIIRSVRLLRVFRVLKLVQFVGEASNMAKAVKASANKIIVFIAFILIVSTIIGTMMYMIEGRGHGFTSIPRSIYWAVVTLTTVGYGDISPATEVGQFLAMCLMIMGYGVIAVPTGLVTAEMIKSSSAIGENKTAIEKEFSNITCPNCSSEGHKSNAKFCSDCGQSF